MTYQAPLNDQLFVLQELGGLAALRHCPEYADATDDIVGAVLSESARFCQEVLAPLNRTGDLQPATVHEGVVTTTPGFPGAFRAFSEAGWQGIQHPEEFGGQGLPRLVAAACMEMVNSANLAFALCPLLTDGAIEALRTAGTPEQQQQFIPPMIEGRWTGTMNLTEPQAGSDLAMVRTRAEPQPDGTYRIFGQKIFITYGDHDLAENIIHLVLARVPGAPEGIRGLSLFLVPKFLVGDDGKPGARNDVWCASLEHKLGIKASPTAVLLFGDGHGAVGSGAIGQRIGAENRGLEYMFIMMNAARFAVGVQGVAISERAYQQASSFATQRIQCRDVEGSAAPVAIIQHPDVQRMLLTMRAITEGARALAMTGAAESDLAHADTTDRETRRRRYEFLVPIIKGFCTESSLEVTSLGIQVHGGVGFIEETGAAQHQRDARILTIYEGTTAIQANDLIGRKILRDGGAVARAFLAEMTEFSASLATDSDPTLGVIGRQLLSASGTVEDALGWLLQKGSGAPREIHAASVPTVMMWGTLLAGWQMARAAERAKQMAGTAGVDRSFLLAKIATAHFYATHILPRIATLHASIVMGSKATLGLEPAWFAR